MSPHRRHLTKPATSSVKWAAQWITVTIVSYVALILALGAPYIFGSKIQAGEIAQRDYTAHEKRQVVDPVRTHEAQDQLRNQVVPVFKKDPTAVGIINKELKAKLDALQAGIVQKSDPPTVDAQCTALCQNLDEKTFPAWRADTERAARRYIQVVEILPANDRKRWEATLFEFLPDKYDEELRRQTAALIAGVLVPTMIVDTEATKLREDDAVSRLAPIKKQIETGTLIIRKGDRLTPEDVAVLEQMGITHTYELNNIMGIAAALLAAFFLFGLFLYTFEPQYFYSPSAIALMATVCVVTCGIAAAVGREYPQFVSLPATALVLTVVFGRQVSIILALLVVVFLKVTELVDNTHLIALSAATAVALSVNISRRKELMLAGVMIGVVQAIAYFIMLMFAGFTGSALDIGRELAKNLLGGMSSCIVGIGSLPFLESIFGVLTPFRIAELSEPDQPLLQQLEENAPGTYQHSLAVANLAEAGAKSIGADVNLVRAGAMYHDIGKMVTPRFFIENQLGDKNPHDDITPEESRAKVLAHVTNGVELARKYSLPKQVEDFIPEHQGTTIMAYFYHKACVRDGAENVKESDYRYPGPKPQCKETAIVMLADVSEAVTHSMRDPSQEEVEAAIANVFKARWDDGQISESGLDYGELELVKQAFVRVWRTLHHERLKYPSTTTGRMPVPPSVLPTTAESGNHPIVPSDGPPPGADCC